MGVTFTMPAGWSPIELDQVPEGAIKSINFSYDKNTLFFYTPTTFKYVSIDAYDDLPEKYKTRYRRSHFNNSLLTVEEFEKLLLGKMGDTLRNTDVTPVTVGKYAYFKVTCTRSIDSDVCDMEIYTHIYNGYWFLFLITDYSEDLSDTELSIESELLSVVETVQFSKETGINAVKTDQEKSYLKAAAGVLVIAVIVGIVIYANRKHKKNERERIAGSSIGAYTVNPYLYPDPNMLSPDAPVPAAPAQEEGASSEPQPRFNEPAPPAP